MLNFTKNFWQQRDGHQWLIVFAIVALVCLLCGRLLVGNWGGIELNQALIAQSHDLSEQQVERAIARLESSASCSSIEQSVHMRLLSLALVQRSVAGQDDLLCETTGSLTADELVTLGEKSLFSNNVVVARRWLDGATTIDPYLGDIYYFQSMAHEDLERYDDAISVLDQVDNTYAFERVGYSDILYRQATLIANQQTPPDWEAARLMLRLAVSHDDFRIEGEFQSRYIKAEAFRHLGDRQRAIQEFEYLAENLPSHYMARLMLGYMLTISDSLRAEQMFNEAISINANGIYAYLGLGNLYKQMGKSQDALEMYQTVLSLSPDNQQALSSIQSLPSDE